MMMKKELNSLIPPFKIRFDEICNGKWETFFIIQVMNIRDFSIN